MTHFNLLIKDELWNEFKSKTNNSKTMNDWIVELIKNYCEGKNGNI